LVHADDWTIPFRNMIEQQQGGRSGRLGDWKSQRAIDGGFRYTAGRRRGYRLLRSHSFALPRFHVFTSSLNGRSRRPESGDSNKAGKVNTTLRAPRPPGKPAVVAYE